MTKIVGCFIEIYGKFLILLRHADKPEGGTWGLPAGKVADGENSRQAMIREIFEETGYQANADRLEYLGEWPFPHAGVDYLFITYRLKMTERPMVALNSKEHTNYEWVSADECDRKANLIHGFHDLLRLTGYIKN